MKSADFKLSRNAAGRLVFTDMQGNTHEGVVPVRAFPISAPDAGLSLIGEDGHELRWISSLNDMPENEHALLESELTQREFMPEIIRINEVSSFATPSKWLVSTNRGDTEMLLKAEDHIRRLSHTSLLITDGHGVSFLIRNFEVLDKHSRKLLERFL